METFERIEFNNIHKKVLYFVEQIEQFTSILTTETEKISS